jgi:hypothetical protein
MTGESMPALVLTFSKESFTEVPIAVYKNVLNV